VLIPDPAQAALRRTAQKKRAATARAAAIALKTWTTEVATVARTTLWRPRSVWLEESTGARCAELVHVGDGSERLIRLVDVLTPEQRAQALETQLQSARAPTTTPSDR
jgi:hypothetical protein